MAQHSSPLVFCVGLPVYLFVLVVLASPAIPVPTRPHIIINIKVFSTCRQRNLQNLFGKEDVVFPMHYIWVITKEGKEVGR